MDKRDADTAKTSRGWTRIRTPELAHAEAELERSRQRVAQSMTALRRHAATQMEWREWVRKHPVPLVLVAFAVGLYVGYRTASSHLE